MLLISGIIYCIDLNVSGFLMCNNDSHFFLFFIADYPREVIDLLYDFKEDDDLYLFTGNDKAQN